MLDAMRTASTPVISSIGTAVREAQWGRTARFVGLAIASIMPAVFWCIVAELIAYWAGISLSPIAVGALFLTIATFLFAICAPLILRNASPDDRAAKRTALARNGRPASN
ncbi:hypothetical protein [Hyphomicrobium sp. 2TAF46]|uniref:hypothetical protein n=1 Tax=Hyphomicrobium sp. 2TAF46 TaxID=3233019 RepID=UPI003F91CA09